MVGGLHSRQKKPPPTPNPEAEGLKGGARLAILSHCRREQDSELAPKRVRGAGSYHQSSITYASGRE